MLVRVEMLAQGERTGSGRISFVVPKLEPGDYVLMVFCPSCAPTSAGTTMLEVADFTVTPSPPTTDTLPSTPPSSFAVVGLVAALLAAVGGLAVVRRTGRRRPDRHSRRPRA